MYLPCTSVFYGGAEPVCSAPIETCLGQKAHCCPKWPPDGAICAPKGSYPKRPRVPMQRAAIPKSVTTRSKREKTIHADSTNRQSNQEQYVYTYTHAKSKVLLPLTQNKECNKQSCIILASTKLAATQGSALGDSIVCEAHCLVSEVIALA